MTKQSDDSKRQLGYELDAAGLRRLRQELTEMVVAWEDSCEAADELAAQIISRYWLSDE